MTKGWNNILWKNKQWKKNTREEKIIEVEEHLSLEIHVEYNKPERCKQMQKHNEGRWKWRGVK
jgi:hypothetical protein